MERIFPIMEVSDTQRVALATFMLEGDAQYWWEATQRRLDTNSSHVITWAEFTQAFYNKYFPASFRRAKEREFLNLKQGDLSVAEYEVKFTKLSRFAPTLPPPTPAGMLPAYSGAPPTHLQPPTSLGAPLARASQTSSASDDQALIAALEGTVNQMATNMAKLVALLRGPNRASLSSMPPPGQGPTADPTPWVPPTQAPQNMEVPVPPTLHTSVAHPFTSSYPLPPAPRPSLSHRRCSCPQSRSCPRFLLSLYRSQRRPTRHLHRWFSRRPAPHPINTTFYEPGTPTHAAQFASSTHFFPEADAEQERRLKRMEETIRALQAGDARPCAHPNLISSGHACARLSKRGLGVSTFPGTRDERT
ncbi:hypothetical protein CRG98_021070 [Punica granatum]|uniref:Retrotransposon gag domain-containing protein n=1 Tax=Punica granatum TaxID=22663 RepID=A0A2I0JQG5_PUNGR|nr:hypothetical protein CRG98_021070 [Punica granatum]